MVAAVVFGGTFTATYLWLRRAAGAAVSNAIAGSVLMALAIVTAGRVWGLV